MATITYDRYGDTETTTVTNLTPAAALALGMDLYHEALPHLSYEDITREVNYAAETAVIHVLDPVSVQIRATAEETEEMHAIGAAKIAARNAAFVERMNAIEDIEERVTAVLAARNQW